ncbi:hypothetical protein WOC76_08010 [Methylocystis sp. IM3]|uniref:hypothetical protein n=1 Tax=unclassified Methylocystis TaxID=2625913 RepID=UPI0030F76067
MTIEVYEPLASRRAPGLSSDFEKPARATSYAACGPSLQARLEALWLACVIAGVAGVLPLVMLLHR